MSELIEKLRAGCVPFKGPWAGVDRMGPVDLGEVEKLMGQAADELTKALEQRDRAIELLRRASIRLHETEVEFAADYTEEQIENECSSPAWQLRTNKQFMIDLDQFRSDIAKEKEAK